MPLSVTAFVQNEEIQAGIPVPGGLCCQTWARRLGRAGSLDLGYPQKPGRAGVRDGVLTSEQPRDQAGDPAWHHHKWDSVGMEGKLCHSELVQQILPGVALFTHFLIDCIFLILSCLLILL